MQQEYVFEMLDNLIVKFEQVDSYNKKEDIEGIKRVVKTISDEEIQVIEGLCNTFKEMAENLKYLKNNVYNV